MMGQHILKMWGSYRKPISKAYLNDDRAFHSVGFNNKRRRILPAAIRPGTKMVLYAAGHQRVVGISEVTSEVIESAPDEHHDEYGDYPFYVRHRIILLAPLCTAPLLELIHPLLKARQRAEGNWRGESYVPITEDDYKTLKDALRRAPRFLVCQKSEAE
jgi:hypothetical protein